MTKKTHLNHVIQPQTRNNQQPRESTIHPAGDDLLKNVDRLLQEGSPEKALKLISQSKSNSPWTKNATAVCQLRLGNAQIAVDIYRSILLTGEIFLRTDTPTVFKTNFATALLMSNNLSGFYRTMSEVKEDNHPAVIKLNAAVKAWRDNLSFWQKLMMMCGNESEIPIELGFHPGDLE